MKEYDWQAWIDSFDTDGNGRIIVTEEEEKEHMIKMRVVNKDHKNKFTKEYIDSIPKDKDGYIIITPEAKARHTIEMKWISMHYPNCRYLPFSEQDKIGNLAVKARKELR
jgi:hypothetical protein